MPFIGYADPSVPTRFWDKVRVSEDGCWLWTAYTSKDGYGKYWIDGTNKNAHRALWETAVGPIDEGMHVDHLCRVRHCVNPAHLEVVTPKENTIRGNSVKASKARIGPKHQRWATHCNKGHEMTEDNVYTSPNHGRYCRECGRKSSREYQARKRAR